MENNLYKQLKDKAFQTKNEDEWRVAMQEIAAAVKNDPAAAEALRKYCAGILEKKRVYWEKTKNRPAFTAKPKMLLSPETDAAIGELARTLTAYLQHKMN